MGGSVTLFFLVVFSFIFFSQLPCNINSSMPTNPNQEKVCRRTNIYHFCTAALSSDPRTPGADFFTLAEIALGLSLANFADNLVFVQRAYQSSTDEALKECLRVCGDLYADGGNDLAGAIHALEGKNYMGMRMAVGAAEGRAVRCEEELGRRRVVSPALREMNLYAKNMCVVSGATGELLEHSLESFRLLLGLSRVC